MDRQTFELIKRLKILQVADQLGIRYSPKGTWRMALCCCHNDHHPSMGLNVTGNYWKCFVCGKGGSAIHLVMEHEQLSFTEACEWLIRKFQIPVPDQKRHQSLIQIIQTKLMNENLSNPSDAFLPSSLPERFKGDSNTFTRAICQRGFLTYDQMRHAASVFRLSTLDDNVIFWQIDANGNLLEGKVMYYQSDAHRSHSQKPVTISWLLKKERHLPDEWKARRCLFGLHQLNASEGNEIIAVVESEKTAIICSELMPGLPDPQAPQALRPIIWLATGGLSNLTCTLLLPLKGRRIILFPDTDADGSAFRTWSATAEEAAKLLGHPVTVSDLLEHHASDDQKRMKIDIADFLLAERE